MWADKTEVERARGWKKPLASLAHCAYPAEQYLRLGGIRMPRPTGAAGSCFMVRARARRKRRGGICRRMNRLLAGTVVYSDDPHYDGPWLMELFAASYTYCRSRRNF